RRLRLPGIRARCLRMWWSLCLLECGAFGWYCEVSDSVGGLAVPLEPLDGALVAGHPGSASVAGSGVAVLGVERVSAHPVGDGRVAANLRSEAAHHHPLMARMRVSTYCSSARVQVPVTMNTASSRSAIGVDSPSSAITV